MFDNLRMSSQAAIPFHSETFGNLLIDIQTLAKKKKPHFSWTHSNSFDLET